MFTNLPGIHAIHNHVSNRVREVVGEAVSQFRADVLTEQERGTGLRRRHGVLYGGTKTETRWGSRGVTVTASNDVPYAPFLEFGTRPHVIRPKSPGGFLRFFWTKTGKWMALRKVNHPGNRTYNFLRRAVGVAGERVGFALLYSLGEIARRF